MALKTRIAKLEARTGGGDDFMAFKDLIEAIHDADPIAGFDEGYAEREARRMCDAGYTIASFAAELQKTPNPDELDNQDTQMEYPADQTERGNLTQI